MHDTTPEIDEKMREMFQKKTPLERLKMGCSMYETSKQLIIRSILQSNPNISKIELRKQFFLKFYGNDFDPETRDQIVQHLERVSLN